VEHNSEWRLLGASIALELALGFFFGTGLCVRLFLGLSATWLVFCALATHGVRWFSSLTREWDDLLTFLPTVSSTQRWAAKQLASDFLWYVYTAYELMQRIRHIRDIADQPCICGAARPDGSRPSQREHCWGRRLPTRRIQKRGVSIT
jgi:hypothetical protein